MSNRLVLSQALSGLRVTGAGAAITTTIIGSLCSGYLRQESVCFGPRGGGVGATARMRSTRVTGGRPSVSTGALITVTAIPETATGADAGVETLFSTTPL